MEWTDGRLLLRVTANSCHHQSKSHATHLPVFGECRRWKLFTERLLEAMRQGLAMNEHEFRVRLRFEFPSKSLAVQ